MTPERFAAFFDTITSVEMKAMKPEDLIEVPARYEKAKDERIRGKLNYSPENTDRIPSSFDKKKWNDILREHTRTYKSGEEKSRPSNGGSLGRVRGSHQRTPSIIKPCADIAPIRNSSIRAGLDGGASLKTPPLSLYSL